MKHKQSHILSFLLIILMIVFTIATTIAPNYIQNRISYENHDGYFLIKIETIQPPSAYHMYNFQLVFDGRDERQTFLKTDHENNFRIILYNKEAEIIEDNLIDELIFETFIENDLYIIKIEEELLKYIKYDNWKVSSITFRNEKSPGKRTKTDVYK